MAKNSVIKLNDITLEQADWLICDEQGAAVTGVRTDTLEHIASQVEGQKVIVIVPSEWVTLLTATVPGSSARAIKAIPFALEDFLSEDVEDLHFAIGEKQNNDNYPVAVISHDLMREIQTRLSEVSLRPTQIRPEQLSLPRFQEAENGWTGLLADNRLIVRLDDYNGFAVESEYTQLLMENCLEEAEDAMPAGMVVFSTEGETWEFNSESLHVEQRPCEDVVSLLARGVHNSTAINLLQGNYSFKQQFSKAWKPWRPAMALAAVLLLAFGASKFVEQHKLSKQVIAQKSEMESILKRTFPSIKRIVDPRKQMASEMKKLGSGGSSSGFVSVVNSLNKAISAAGNTKLNSISYKSGRLDLDLETDKLSTLDSLKTTMEGEGRFKMKIESANQSNGRIRGRIRVEIRG